MDPNLPVDQGITRNGHAYLRIGEGGAPLCLIDELHFRPRPVEGLTLQGMLQTYEAYLEVRPLLYIFRRAEPPEEEASTGDAAEAEPAGRVTIRHEAESYLNALFDFGLPRIHLLGISYGGLVAQEMAATAPQLFRSLVVAIAGCSVAEPMRRELRRFAEFARERRWRELHAGMTGALHQHSSFRSFFRLVGWSVPKILGIPEDPERVAAMFEGFAEADLCERTPAITVPTLLISGDRDPYVDPEELTRMVDRLPQGELELFPGAGHSLLRAKAEAVEQRILPFLAAAEE